MFVMSPQASRSFEETLQTGIRGLRHKFTKARLWREGWKWESFYSFQIHLLTQSFTEEYHISVTDYQNLSRRKCTQAHPEQFTQKIFQVTSMYTLEIKPGNPNAAVAVHSKMNANGS